MQAKGGTAAVQAKAAAHATKANKAGRVGLLWLARCSVLERIGTANGGRLLLVKGAGRVNVPGRAQTCLDVPL